MTGGPLNLSLLSRGVGEVHKNGHEKVDVYLEPEDYYNFSTNPDRFYLPPIHSEYSPYIDASPSFTTRSSREAQEFRVPKTFTTRKGALLLFSEDLAQRNMERPAKRRITDGHQHGSSITPATSLDSQVSLKTVEDLANSILKYGAHDRPEDEVYLKFVHARRDNFERQIRPGYSAKRYLSTWTRTWDDSVFDNIIKHGYITERSLYHYNLVVPGLRRRLFHEDLSHMPQPYRLMRNMLMTPGSLSGYTFYRAATQELLEEDEGQESESIVLRKRPDNLRNIRVIKTKGGVQEEVAYSDLDRQSQKEVITDLLVKSAVHYALKKQEELYEESIIRAVQSEQNGGILVAPDRRDSSAVREFDMKEAVESLLDSQHGRFAIGADLPEIDDRSYSSDTGGSFKGGAIPSRLVKQHQASHRPSWPADGTDSDKEYMGGVPVVAVRDGSDASSHHSSIPVLPPIRQTLSPIKDVSRETTQHNITLPPLGRDGFTIEPPVVQVHPATPQHSILTGGSTSDANATRGLISRDADALPDLDEDEKEAETVTEGDRMSRKRGDTSGSSVQSSEKGKGKTSASETGAGDSITQPHAGSTTGTGTTITTKNRTQWKGLRKGPGSQAESMKGSMIMAPDGEIISVGGSVARGAGHPYDVGNINDVMGHHRHEGAATDESGASDDEPDEWKMAKKLSISQRSESIKKPFKRGSATSSSVSKEELDKLNPAGKYLLWNQATRVSGESGSQRSPRSSLTEKDIMDTLTDHAQRIAESVLSHPAAGADLESDVQKAAEIWAETHPPRPLSRAHSVREFRAEAIEEIMRNRRASSAAPSAAEYRALIKKSLATAAAKAAGLDPDMISDDAEISPDLLDALASQKLTPDQLEIVSDSEGRTRIQSRVDLNEVMGGVQDGHLYIAPGKKGEEGIGKRQISIPADKVSVMDDVEFDRISYQGTDAMSEKGKSKSKAGSKAGSIAGGTMADLAEMEGMMAAIEGKVEKGDENVEPEDDFLKAVQQATGEPSAPSVPSEPRQPTSGKTTPSAVEQDAASQKAPPHVEDAGQKTPPTLPDGGPGEKRSEDARSVKSNKTGVSQKSEASKDSKKKEKEEPFVVGKPKEKKPKKEPLPPKKEEKKKKGKKGKKGKKKEEEEPAPAAQPVEKAPEPEPPAPEIVEKEPTPRQPTPSSHKPSSPEFKTDESDLEFNFVREQSSPDSEVPAQTKLQIPSPPLDEDDKSDAENGEEEEESNLKSISNREARAAKRAAAAAKRKEEVERRRREKEEQAKREKEEVERQVALQREMEEERRRREEERRIRKQQQKDAEEREWREREESERRQKLEADRERKAKEDYQRKLEEMKRKQHEEEMRKHELMLQRQKEEEERRAEEELMLSQMAEQERLEYERKKREEEEERKRKEMEEKLRRAEEARKAMEEAQRLAEEMARKQAELEARLKFNRALQEEASGLSHAHEINRAFVFSYFELLQWLGLDIPEFELAKLADY